MKREQSIRKTLLIQNMHSSQKIRLKQNKKEEENEKSKENINHSYRRRKNKNHFVYLSKYSISNNISLNNKRENNKILSDDIESIDEDLDHPKPLNSDCEEELEDLKCEFSTNKDKKEYLFNNLNLNKNDVKNSIDIPVFLGSTMGESTQNFENSEEANKNKGIEEHNNIRKNNKLPDIQNNENDNLSLKKVELTENESKRQQIKNKFQIKNKINNNNLNNIKKNNIQDNNTIEKDIQSSNININLDNNQDNKNLHIIKVNNSINRIKQEFINNYDNDINKDIKRINQIDTLNKIKKEFNIDLANEKVKRGKVLNKVNQEINIDKETKKEQLFINNSKEKEEVKTRNCPKIYKYMSKIKIENNNNIDGLMNSNDRNKKIYKDNNMPNSQKIKLLNKIRIENSQMKKVLYEENEKNNSKENLVKTEPNIASNISKNKIRALDTKNLILNKENQYNITDRDYEISEVNSYKIIKNKNLLYNIPNKYSRLNSKETNISNLHERHNNFSKRRNESENNSRYRKKTFEKGGSFNNLQTTYIIISKNQRIKGDPKVKIAPQMIDYSKIRFINPTPSANYISYSKLYKGNIPLYSPYTYDIRFQRNTVCESKKIGITRSQNILPIKKYYDYKDLISDKDSYKTNNRSYIDSSMNRKGLYRNNNRRSTHYLINKSQNNNQNTIPLYNDYNFYYFNGYNYDMKQEAKNLYIPYNNNYHY